MFIPDKYVLDTELSSNEKVILTLIYSFNKVELLSTSFIAKELGLTSPTVLKSLRILNSRCLINYNGNVIEKKVDVEEEFNSCN